MPKTFEKMTRPNMRKLAAGGKINENGICFERLRNGDGVYSINVMVDRLRVHRVIGRESDGTTRTQAEDFLGTIRSEAKHGRLSLPKGRKVALSFGDAASEYLRRLPAEGGKDMKMKASRLNLHLIPFFGSMTLSKISSFDIERYKHKRQQEWSLRGGDRVSDGAKAKSAEPPKVPKKAAAGTINRELAVLSHVFNTCIEWKLLEARPAQIKRLTESNGRIFYLTVAQTKRLIECAKESDNPHVYPFIVIAVETSMRMMEILSIRRENVDLDKRMIYVPKAKAGQREQPITTHLANFLAGYIAAMPQSIPWLFRSPSSKSGHAVDIRKPFLRAVEEAGLDPAQVVRHTLRHTAITHLVQAGVDLPTVKRISGHKTLAMVERYSHQSGEHIHEAMDALQNRMKLA